MTNGSEHAFPHLKLEGDGIIHLEGGLTKREYFAAKAMQALISCWMDGGNTHSSKVSEQAVELADALLSKLAKDKK